MRFRGIEQEGLSEAFPLFADIDCQASEEDDSDWMIRQSLGDSLRAFMLVNRPDNTVLPASYVGLRRICLLVLPGELLHPRGERRICTIKR
jgi:hypothetical protein